MQYAMIDRKTRRIIDLFKKAPELTEEEAKDHVVEEVDDDLEEDQVAPIKPLDRAYEMPAPKEETE